MNVLDLFSGGGGAGKGMILAGCNVIGVDSDPLCAKWYPGEFILQDVFTLEHILDWKHLLKWADVVWASPICRKFSAMTKIRGNPDDHPDQIPGIRALLKRWGKPYIIENVPGAPLNTNLMLCGLMFGLHLYRHRIFECSLSVPQPAHPKHHGQQKFSVVGRLAASKAGGSAQYYAMKDEWPRAMGIAHIGVNASTSSGHNMFSQAIPPAFSKYILEQYIRILEGK